MRLLDEHNSPIEKSEAVKKMYSQVFLNDPEQKFLINSFCLQSLVDFYNFRDNCIYSDFIQRWTRRALEEELDISKEDETVLGENELETKKSSQFQD